MKNNSENHEIAKSLLSNHGHAILRQNIHKWTDLREVQRCSVIIPKVVKNKIAKLSPEISWKVNDELKKLIFEKFPEKWRIFFITGKRYALESDLILDSPPWDDYENIYEGIHAYQMISYAKEFFKSTESLGINIDVEIQGIDPDGNVNPYLKLYKSQIKSIRMGFSI